MRRSAVVILCLAGVLAVAALGRKGGGPQPGTGSSWLGVQVLAVDGTVSRNFNLACRRGLLVRRVISDSPAERSGLLPGDVIRRIGGTRVTDTVQLKKVVDTASPRQRKRIVVMRGGAGKTLYATLEPRPSWTAVTGAQQVHSLVPVGAPPVDRPYPYFYFGEGESSENE